jgi:hypothetical protein
MDQPTAGHALKEMEVLVGEWSQQATAAGGEPWPGEAQTTFEWLEGGQLLLERSAVEMPLGVRRRKRLADRLRPRLHTGALGSLDHVAGAGFQVAAGATATKAAKELGLVRTESAECC